MDEDDDAGGMFPECEEAALSGSHAAEEEHEAPQRWQYLHQCGGYHAHQELLMLQQQQQQQQRLLQLQLQLRQATTTSPPRDACLCGAPAKMECLICARVGMKPLPTFCCVECYKEHWRTHRAGGVPCEQTTVMSEWNAVTAQAPIIAPFVGPVHKDHTLPWGLWHPNGMSDPLQK